MGVSHQAFGICLAAIAVNAGYLDMSMWFALPLASAGSLFPDVDSHHSKLGRRIYPVSALINQLVGHRTFFHSLIAWGLTTAGFYYLNTLWPDLPQQLWAALSLGHLSHLVGDMAFGGGVQLFWPYKRRIKVIPSRWSVGRLHEFAFLCIFLATTAFATGFHL